jgi:membrane protein
MTSHAKLVAPGSPAAVPPRPGAGPCDDSPQHSGFFGFLWDALSAWNNHDGPRLSAALAFYATLSLAPLLVLMVSVAALFFGRSGAQNRIVAEVQVLLGSEAGNAVKNVLFSAQKPAAGILSTITSLIVVMIGASGVFSEVRAALNRLWEISPQTNGGILELIKDRIFAFGLLLAIGCLLLLSLMLSAALTVITTYWADVLPLPGFLLRSIGFVVSFVAVAVLFALTFRYVPDRAMPWRHIWRGAVLTSLLFTVGKELIGIYLGKAAMASVYGAAGSLMVLIAWVYYSSMSLYLGAELTRALDLRRKRQEGARA